MSRDKRFLWSITSDNTDNSTTYNRLSDNTDHSTTLNITSAPKQYMVPDESGAIAGVVFGILLSIGLIVAAVYLYRQKRQRESEYRRTANIQSRSMKNAGVYMDTTTDTLVPNPRTQSKDDASISLHKNPDLYEDDSEDEI